MCDKCRVRLCLCVQVFLLLFTCVVRGFNVDIENFVKHTGEPGSMFGFSVAEHKERGSNWLLVGAPEAQTPQPGVKRGGAVYRCDITMDDHCQQIPFDRTGNNNNSNNAQLDSKSYQWFGATVRSSGEDGVIVACAPRYVWYTTQLNRRDPVGTCYVAKNQMSDFSEFSPCRTRNWGYHRQGSCQAGLGASISKDGKRLFIGAVGSWYWQGQIHSCDSRARLPFPMPPRYAIVDEKGQIISQNLYSRPEVIPSNEGPPADDDSYLGYSVASGDFSGGGGQNDVAVGMPRGAGLLGKIVLFTWNMTNLHNITGEQLGAYFGYSLAAADMDGDGLDDLVIGAPLYTDLKNNEGDYETGRVYVVYQGKSERKFLSMDWRDGVNSKCRFGLALAALGDINKDGFGDVAIGAPYDQPQERGAVYIYHGSAEGIREKPSQVIRATDLGLPVTTFGFSLSGGVDMDENQYPDLIVGAYESDTAVFLKARPVVKMMASVSFLSDQKQVVLEETNCTLKDGTRVACLSLKMCLEYSGLGVDRSLDFDVQLTVDSKKPKSPRMSFLSAEGQSVQNQTLTLDKGLQRCQEVFVYVKNGIRDKLTSLEAEMRYSLHGAQQQTSYARRRYPRALTPVLDLNEALLRKDTVTIQKNCGKDNVCIPNLRINVTPNVKRYLLGSNERLSVDVVVINEGEDAFEAVYDMKVPPGINYVNIERLDTERDVFVQCSAPSFVNNNTLHCDIGNPLPKEKTVHFKVLLQPFHQAGMKARYEFDIAVNSTNPENKTSSADNQQHLVVPIWVETDLILKGSSHPPIVHYNTSAYNEWDEITHESEIGPQVVHIYSIRNKGPSDIVEADVHFLWPASTLTHNNLLYLLEQPELSGPIKCELAPNVNPYNFALERKRKSYLELGGILGNQEHFTGSYSSSGGVTIEESSSSTSSSSSSSSGGHTVVKSTTSLTKEERRRLEEADKRDKVEAAAESGDSSQRYHKRIHSESETSDRFGGGSSRGSVSTSYSGGGSSRGSSGGGSSRGSVSTSYSGETNSGQGYEESSGSSANQGGGIRVESGTYRGRGSQGTVVSDRGRIAGGGGSFDTYSTFDNDRSGGNYGGSQSSRTGGSAAETKINQRQYGSDEKVQGYGQDGYVEKHSSSQNVGENRVVTGSESVTRRNQTSYQGVDIGSNSPVNIGGVQNRTFSREEETSSNTTWNSGGRPITHTSTSWRENENGAVRSGSSSNAYEATNINIGDMMARGRQGSGRTDSGGSGGSSYSSESTVSRQYNSEGEQLIGAGSSTGTRYGGGGSYLAGSESDRREGYGSSSGYDSRSIAGGVTIGYDSRTRNDPNAIVPPANSRTYNANSGSSGSGGFNARGSYDTNAARGSSSSGGFNARGVYDANAAAGSSSSGGLDSRRTYDANSMSGSSQFDALAGIAQGPRDGVARTYSFDVDKATSRSGGASDYGSVASVAAGSKDVGSRGHNFDMSRHDVDKATSRSGGASDYGSVASVAAGSKDVGSRGHNFDMSRQGGSAGVSGRAGSHYSNSSSHQGSWSATSDGGKHYVSGAWNSEEDDYDKKYPAGRDNVDYDNNERKSGGSSWRSSSTWESRNAGGYYEANPDASSRQARIRNYQPAAFDNIVDDEDSRRYKANSRSRRQLDSDDESLEDINCGPVECVRIRCTVGPLTRDQEAWVAFRSRVWVRTLQKFAYNPSVQLSSVVAGRVSRLPHIGAPDSSSVHSAEVVTQVDPRDTAVKSDVVPLWVVVLSACAGALILMLLVYLLYKCGFFKRNRPSSDVPEKQPLNRNGHYQSGDEAL